MTTTEVTIPTILISAGTPGHPDVEIEGLDHPVRLARYGRELADAGLHRMALAVSFALALSGRCALCGRLLTSKRSADSIIGRECVHPRQHRTR